MGSASGGVHLTRASSDSSASASGGVHLTRACSVSSASASGGVHLTRASSVSSASASGGVHLTRASGDPATIHPTGTCRGIHPTGTTSPVRTDTVCAASCAASSVRSASVLLSNRQGYVLQDPG